MHIFFGVSGPSEDRDEMSKQVPLSRYCLQQLLEGHSFDTHSSFGTGGAVSGGTRVPLVGASQASHVAVSGVPSSGVALGNQNVQDGQSGAITSQAPREEAGVHDVPYSGVVCGQAYQSHADESLDVGCSS